MADIDNARQKFVMYGKITFDVVVNDTYIVQATKIIKALQNNEHVNKKINDIRKFLATQYLTIKKMGIYYTIPTIYRQH